MTIEGGAPRRQPKMTQASRISNAIIQGTPSAFLLAATAGAHVDPAGDLRPGVAPWDRVGIETSGQHDIARVGAFYFVHSGPKT